MQTEDYEVLHCHLHMSLGVISDLPIINLGIHCCLKTIIEYEHKRPAYDHQKNLLIKHQRIIIFCVEETKI